MMLRQLVRTPDCVRAVEAVICDNCPSKLNYFAMELAYIQLWFFQRTKKNIWVFTENERNLTTGVKNE
jgi:hypothetical protein